MKTQFANFLSQSECRSLCVTHERNVLSNDKATVKMFLAFWQLCCSSFTSYFSSLSLVLWFSVQGLNCDSPGAWSKAWPGQTYQPFCQACQESAAWESLASLARARLSRPSRHGKPGLRGHEINGTAKARLSS